VVPDLISYYGNRLSINDADVPMDRQLTLREQVMAPPYRGGILVRFDAKKSQFVRGNVLIGDVVVPAFGELVVHEGTAERRFPLGAQGEFECENLASGQFAAEVLWEDGSCKMELMVPKSSSTVVDIGILHCGGSATKLPSDPDTSESEPSAASAKAKPAKRGNVAKPAQANP